MMSNEVFELIRSVFILFFLCNLIYRHYKQGKLINELRKKVIEAYQRGYAAAERDLKREPLSVDEKKSYLDEIDRLGVESNRDEEEIDRLTAENAMLKEKFGQPERMTGCEISQGFQADRDATSAESYWAGVALAEKHYGVKTNETL